MNEFIITITDPASEYAGQTVTAAYLGPLQSGFGGGSFPYQTDAFQILDSGDLIYLLGLGGPAYDGAVVRPTSGVNKSADAESSK